LATRVLVALPGAKPEVMDLPSMARVTKLPIETLKEKAASTPAFAPSLDNLIQIGAVRTLWSDALPLAGQLEALLREIPDTRDRRDELGRERDGRPKAHDIAERVHDLALQSR
ncbi:MAG: biotin-independent malonate decarboxylase subunit gamma, partial [Pseudomonadota bacterium]|nr:biotin-independent malonate decarboxylase subunit gamma [Pseudomonadota bacterium]